MSQSNDGERNLITKTLGYDNISLYAHFNVYRHTIMDAADMDPEIHLSIHIAFRIPHARCQGLRSYHHRSIWFNLAKIMIFWGSQRHPRWRVSEHLPFTQTFYFRQGYKHYQLLSVCLARILYSYMDSCKKIWNTHGPYADGITARFISNCHYHIVVRGETVHFGLFSEIGLIWDILLNFWNMFLYLWYFFLPPEGQMFNMWYMTNILIIALIWAITYQNQSRIFLYIKRCRRNVDVILISRHGWPW